MSSTANFKHTVTEVAPTGASIGDEYYKPSTNELFKRIVYNGNSVRWVKIVSSDGSTLVLDGSNLVLTTNNTERMRIDGSGNVGIGTANPRGRLDVVSTAGVYGSDTITFGPGTLTYPTPQFNNYGAIVAKGAQADARLMVQDGNGRINNYWNAYTDTGGYKYITSGEPAARDLMHINGTTGAASGSAFSWYGAPGGTAGTTLTWTQIAGLASGTAGYAWLSPRGTSSDFYIDAVSNVMVGYTTTTSTSSNSLLVAGNVGIGTNAPSYPLHISAPTGQVYLSSSTGTNFVRYSLNNTGGSFQFGIDNSAGSNYFGSTAYGRAIFSDGAYPIGIFTNGAEHMRIDPTGNVYIGATSATWNEKLSVNLGSSTTNANVGLGIYHSAGSGYTGSMIRVQAETTGTGWKMYEGRGPGGSVLYWVDGTGAGYFSSNVLVGYASTTTPAASSLLVAGDVGIGTNAPTQKLTVTGGLLEMRDGNGIMIRPSGNTNDTRLVALGTDGLDVVWGGATSTSMVHFSNAGNVGIGTGTGAPAATLQVYNATSAIIALDGDSTTAYRATRYSTDANLSQFIVRKARGTLASPSAVATSDIAGGLFIQAYGGTNFRNIARIDGFVETYTSDTNISGALRFFTNTSTTDVTEKMRIDSAGQLLIGTASVIGAASYGIQVAKSASVVGSVSTIKAGGNSPSFELLNFDNTQNWYFGIQDAAAAPKSLYIGRGYGPNQNIAPAISVSTTDNVTMAGTLTTSARGIAKASMPAGTVLQVVSSTLTTYTTSTSSTDVTVGLSATITPTSATSKILVMYSLHGGSTNSFNATIYRGASAICIGTSTATRTSTSTFIPNSAGVGAVSTQSQKFLDSPATTSATTYDIRCSTDTGTFAVNRRSSDTFISATSTITLMEIAA